MRESIGLTLTVALGLTALASVPATANFINGPASAGIVERFSEPGMGFWVDVEDELVVIANADSVADVCSFNPAGPGEIQELTLPGGVIVSLLHDDDVPVLVIPLPAPNVDPCNDPENYPVIATGTGDVRGNDNDVEESGSRMNSFGQRLTGHVIDGNGDAWSMQAHFRARINKDGDFLLTRESINLAKRGK